MNKSEKEKGTRAPGSIDLRNGILLKVCPVCKKKFVPAPAHAWKIKYDALVCSYTCMRVVEKADEAKRRARDNG